MGGMDVCGMDTGAGLSFPERSDTNNSVSKLVLSNNLSYNLYSFVQELVYLEKSLLLKMVCMEQKMILLQIKDLRVGQ